MSNKIKFAVIGCGHIGKRHAEMISRNSECELIALCDTRDESLLNIEQYNIPFYSSVEELLENEKNIEVVSICTPNGKHTEQALKALEYNKHVVVEKPLGLTKADCEKVIYKSLRQNKHVFGVMQNRYSPPSEWLKSVIDDKKLGDIYMVQVNCYWNRDERYYKTDGWKGKQDLDGGTLFTQFSHFIDIMCA